MDLPEGVRRERIEPLWSRVDRNRVKFALFIVGYLLSIAASAAVVTAVGAALAGLLFLRTPGIVVGYYANIDVIVLGAALTSLALGSVWVAFVLTRSEKQLLGRLGAVLTPTGQYTTTKLVLKDMALAAGLAHAPALWLIPDCERVNAFAVGRSLRTSVMGVTQGFVDRLTPDDQRAVFANLVARLTNGDVRWATGVSALVGPIWQMRDRDLRRDEENPLSGEHGIGASDPTSAVIAGAGRGSGDAAAGAAGWFVMSVLVIVVTEVLLAGHQRSSLLTAEKADAEGMLLLKDPQDMLQALEKVLEANNTVPSAREAYSALFYCWAGFGYAPEDDPEYQRLARLREVLGVEALVVRPAVPMPAHPEEYVSPPAPRVDRDGSGS